MGWMDLKIPKEMANDPEGVLDLIAQRRRFDERNRKHAVEDMAFKRRYLDLDESQSRRIKYEIIDLFQEKQSGVQTLTRMAEKTDDGLLRLYYNTIKEHEQSEAWGIVKAAQAIGIDLLGIGDDNG